MNFIFFSADDWDGIILKRPHHFAQKLAKFGNRVYFLTFGTGSPHQLFKLLFRPQKLLRPKIFSPAKNIFVIDIGTRLPLKSPVLNIFFQPLLFHFNKMLMARVFKFTIATFNLNDFIIIVNNLYSFPIEQIYRFIKKCSKVRGIIYDCIDAFEFFPGFQRQLIRKIEKRITQMASLIFVSAASLKERDVFRNKENVYFLPNGVEIDRFSDIFYELPNEVTYLKKQGYVIIGYTGTIAEWLDFELMIKILEENNNVAICLVGPYSDYSTKSKLLPYLSKLQKTFAGRFTFLGAKRYEEIPMYIHSFDICLIPFRIDNLTHYVNPLKIYEYLACGKAVLSTYWRELDGFSEVIYFIENSINTKPIIDKIISETTNREIIAKRKQFAQRYDWEILIREAYDKILNHFGK